jgi:hypothetical protein
MCYWKVIALELELVVYLQILEQLINRTMIDTAKYIKTLLINN